MHRESYPLTFAPVRSNGAVRGVASLLAALLLPACGSRPLPTLEDYSHSTSVAVARLRPFLAEGGTLPSELLAVRGAGRAVEEVGSRWLSAAEAARSEVRIVGFRRDGSRNAEVEVEVRLEGTARGRADRAFLRTTLRLSFTRAADGAPWRLSSSSEPGGPVPVQVGRPVLFEEAGARGLSARHETVEPLEERNVSLPSTHHHAGLLLADLDGDGALDVLLSGRGPRLYLNDGSGRFRDATAGSGLDGLPGGNGAAAMAADLDGDSLADVVVVDHFGPSRVFRNLGGGRFEETTSAWGLAGLAGPFTSAVLLDADRDGRVDVFLVAYGDARLSGPSFSGSNGFPDRLFLNVETGGRPVFVEATASAGVGDPGWGLAASACDFDADGDDDLYVANDFGTNSLFENRSAPGRPRFVDVARSLGVSDEGFGMGVTWGDYDGDGRWDLYVSDFATPYRWILKDRRFPLPPIPGADLLRPFVWRKLYRRSRGNGLFRQLPDGRFARVSESAGVADGGWAWGTEFVDLDGDGREDLPVVNGMFEATTGVDDEIAFWNLMGREGASFQDAVWGTIDFGPNGMASRTPKRLFLNRGDGTFEERAWVTGFDTRDDARGLAFGDLDGNGAPELVVACFRGRPLLYRNAFPTAGRVRVLLRGRAPNTSAVGAVVRLEAGGRTQLRQVRAGSSYLAQSSLELLFGIGAAPRAERITVRWPDGTTVSTAAVPAGARVVWTQGEPPVVLTGAAAASARLPESYSLSRAARAASLSGVSAGPSGSEATRAQAGGTGTGGGSSTRQRT